MIKKLIIAATVIVVGVVGYYVSFYFRKTTVNEAMPVSEIKSNENAMQEPVVLRQGLFGKIDFIHQGSGTAKLIQNSDGKHFIRFEDFKVTNGPDLYVYLVADAENVDNDEFVNLWRLK
jgi:hypothetical protein